MSALGGTTLLATGDEDAGGAGAYGTPVAVDRRYEFTAESLVRQQTILQPDGINGDTSMTRLGANRVLSNRSGAGDITMEIGKQGFGRWFENMLGGTSTITQQGATDAWLQEHSFGSLADKSLTVLKSLRDADGDDVAAFNFHGVKVANWTLSVSTDAFPLLRVGLDAEDVDTGTSTTAINGLDEPPAGRFSFKDASLTLDGSPVAQVLSAEVNGDNALKTDEYFLGSAGLKGQPPVNDYRTVTGTFNMRFADLATVYNSFIADTGLTLVVSFIGDEIDTAEDEELTITVNNIHFTGDTPQVSGVGVVELTAPWEASNDGTNPFVKIDYKSADVAI